MKLKLLFVFLALIAFMGGYHPLYANNDAETSEEIKKGMIKIGNKTCPVSGNKVDSMGEPFEHKYNGKIYNLCCPACVKDFEKDPEKFSKIAEIEAGMLDPHEDHNHNFS